MMSIKRCIILKENNGFSMAELMIALGISGLLAYGISHLSNSVTKNLKSLELKSDTIISEAFARKLLVEDVMKTNPSFNFIKSIGVFNDSETKNEHCISTKNAKPYFWQVTSEDYCKSVAINLTADKDSFGFFAFDGSTFEKKGNRVYKKAILESPSIFYNTSPSLNYSSSKLRKVFSDNGHMKNGNLVKIQGITPMIDSLGNSRDYAYLLGVVNNSIKRAKFDSIWKPANSQCKENPDSALDNFLRCIQSAGAMARVFVIPVRYVEYQLRVPEKKPEDGFDLYRRVLDYSKGIDHFKERLVAKRVKELSFLRKNTSSKMIDVEISFYKKPTQK
ncbi:MAG: prepilin-type N-terminal cleavage/methylation domain-containing protein [Bacteriovoracaceae bacterium]|nr:prepilin-type N-terminal cleavage/methylation domain-containing protein [Bacteriovoracaceae bacterium]